MSEIANVTLSLFNVYTWDQDITDIISPLTENIGPYVWRVPNWLCFVDEWRPLKDSS